MAAITVLDAQEAVDAQKLSEPARLGES